MRPVLITAGATRNPIDAIRYITANSSGRTGSRIATELAARGLDVHLLASGEAWLRLQAERPADAARVQVEEYGSTFDLLERMERFLLAHPDAVVLHAAAVGDYAIFDRETGKIPSGQPELLLRLRPTPKILDRIRGWAPQAWLCSFKAAAPATVEEELERIAAAQLQRSGSDLVFANVIGDLQSLVLLVSPAGTERFTDRAAALHALVERAAAAAHSGGT